MIMNREFEPNAIQINNSNPSHYGKMLNQVTRRYRDIEHNDRSRLCLVLSNERGEIYFNAKLNINVFA